MHYLPPLPHSPHRVDHLSPLGNSYPLYVWWSAEVGRPPVRVEAGTAVVGATVGVGRSEREGGAHYNPREKSKKGRGGGAVERTPLMYNNGCQSCSWSS